MSDAARGWIIFCSVVAIFGLIGWAIGKPKGRGDAGIVLGMVLGPIGLVVIALLGCSQEQAPRQAGVWTDNPPLPPPTTDGLGAGYGVLQRANGRVACPWCAELILPAAKLCRYCGREVQAERDH